MIDGAPAADESMWVSLAQGTIDYAGYHTVSADWDDEVPTGKGAIVLRVTGTAPSIGTEEYLSDTRGKPLFVTDAATIQGKGFMLQDGAFVAPAVQRGTEDNPFVEEPILCIRAYTVPLEKTDPVDPVEPVEPVEPAPVEPVPDEPVAPAPAKPEQESGPVRRATTNARLPETGDERGVAAGIVALIGLALAGVGGLLSRGADLADTKSQK